ncbi:MAG: DUF4395 domain-containing protein [Microthrixaceae bacterium]
MTRARSVFGFPNPVNEKAARVVATGATLMALAVAILGWGWVLIPLTYGFVARVLTGPTLSPLGRFATGVAAPLLGPAKNTPGPPKRFAQGIGVAFSVTASLLWLLGAPGPARIVVGMLAVAAFLEAALGLCLGCRIFAVLMRLGVIPEEVCEECNDLSLRIPALATTRD